MSSLRRLHLRKTIDYIIVIVILEEIRVKESLRPSHYSWCEDGIISFMPVTAVLPEGNSRSESPGFAMATSVITSYCGAISTL